MGDQVKTCPETITQIGKPMEQNHWTMRTRKRKLQIEEERLFKDNKFGESVLRKEMERKYELGPQQVDHEKISTKSVELEVSNQGAPQEIRVQHSATKPVVKIAK